jgi:Rps23 Pro-64 3,4-dihydroxylase Tpa1-like proline 4-hydroxylase
MKKKFYKDHCHRIIVDDFMSEDDLIQFNKEFYSMYQYSEDGPYRLSTGLVVDKTFKSRKEFDIHQATNNLNLSLSHIWMKYLWSDEMRSFYHKCGGIFPYMNVSSYDHLLGAFYSEGDFYKPHVDLFILTAVFFHQDNTNFIGGDFFLGSSVDKEDPELKFLRIPYVKNRLIIFPSRYAHYAGRVEKSFLEGVDGMRLCTQNFIDFRHHEDRYI